MFTSLKIRKNYVEQKQRVFSVDFDSGNFINFPLFPSKVIVDSRLRSNFKIENYLNYRCVGAIHINFVPEPIICGWKYTYQPISVDCNWLIKFFIRSFLMQTTNDCLNFFSRISPFERKKYLYECILSCSGRLPWSIQTFNFSFYLQRLSFSQWSLASGISLMTVYVSLNDYYYLKSNGK